MELVLGPYIIDGSIQGEITEDEKEYFLLVYGEKKVIKRVMSVPDGSRAVIFTDRLRFQYTIEPSPVLKKEV